MPVGQFRLLTLGRLSLVDSAGLDEQTLSRRPRKLALLAVLAMSGRAVSRETLVEMFWADQDEDRARHSLSDALSHLRRVLGRDALTLHQASVGLSPEVDLRVDAVAFADAVRRGDLAGAISLYDGDFLAQVHAGATFEHWADRERARLGRLFAQSCARHCADLAAEHRWDDGATVAERWLDNAPLSAEPALALLDALSAPGTEGAISAALASYDRLTARLSSEFEEAPIIAVTTRARELESRLTALRALTRSAPPPMPVAPAPRADAFASAPALTTTATTPPHRPSRSRWAAATLLVVVGVGAIFALAVRQRSSDAASVRRNAVAILPFRVTGADSSLGYLREGMVDLLDAKFTGEVGPRSIDPRTVLSAWHAAGGAARNDLATRRAASMAAQLGADQLLFGSVVGTPNRLVLSVELLASPGGQVRARAAVSGPAAELPALVDRLAGELLATAEGENERRLSGLTTTSLPALRAYLIGKNAYRNGQFAVAVRQYRRALELDSSFALAALGIAAAGDWTASSESERVRRGLERAWALRAQLSARDRMLFTAYIGPRFPELRTAAIELANWERAAQAAPDSPEAWYELGDRFFHVGQALGLPDFRQRATAAFSRARALDDAFHPALTHLAELAIQSGDLPTASAYVARIIATDSAATAADFLRWRLAAARHDDVALAELRRRQPVMSVASLQRIVGISQLDGVALGDAISATDALRAQATTKAERLLAYLADHQLALNRGRPVEALASLRLVAGLEPLPPGFLWSVLATEHLAIADALFGDGDSATAAVAYRMLERRTRLPVAHDPAMRAHQNLDLCSAELWRLEHGDASGTAATLARLDTHAPPDSASFYGGNPELCVTMLAALAAAHDGAPDAASRTARLDSLMRSWPPIWGVEFGNLVVARLLEKQGDLSGALAALRRRPYYWTPGPRYLATSLREEGRLAERLGEVAGARRAYQHWLTLRDAPEPPLRHPVDEIRARLVALRSRSGPGS